MKFASVSSFKGAAYVNIRECYEKDGELLPGKKGIALSAVQFDELKKVMSKLDTELKRGK